VTLVAHGGRVRVGPTEANPGEDCPPGQANHKSEVFDVHRGLLDKFYWSFWCITAVLNGVLTGYMVSHSIMLGRFFNWYLESGKEGLLHQTYTVFRASNNAYRLYDIPLGLHLVVGGVWVVLALLVRRQRIIALLAGLATYWVAAIFLGTGLGTAEDAVLTATATPELTQRYLMLNLPIHTAFAVIYATSLLLMLLVPLRERAAEGESRVASVGAVRRSAETAAAD
jgi:hypothetical protein